MAFTAVHLPVTVVIPCYNEESRIDAAEFIRFLNSDVATVRLLFVDDGSTDSTVQVLQRIASIAPRAAVLELRRNQGKAEAVRRGLCHALDSFGSEAVGFWDADLACPLDAIDQLAAVLQRPQVAMVFGARVALLGRKIKRSMKRHYLGRVFATLASLTLSMPIYDTQCGAKLFRASPQLRSVLATPFLTNWVFDVEMIARYVATEASSSSPSAASVSAAARSIQEKIFEFPLEKWEDVSGSKVRTRDIWHMAKGLVTIRLHYFWRAWPDGRWLVSGEQIAVAGIAAAVIFALTLSLLLVVVFALRAT